MVLYGFYVFRALDLNDLFNTLTTFNKNIDSMSSESQIKMFLLVFDQIKKLKNDLVIINFFKI